MLKISCIELEEYKNEYLKKISVKINKNKIEEKEFYNNELKQYLINKLEDILIGGIDELKDIIKKMNDLLLTKDKAYKFCKYLYTTKASTLNTLAAKIRECNAKYDLNINIEDAKEILTRDKRIKYLQKNFRKIYESFCDKATIEILFNYNFISDLEIRNTILNKIGTNVCPYCGRQFISSYKKENKTINTADLDHYYIKSDYPYLALSLFNFIPSCQICNLRMKKTTDFDEINHLYPYLEGFDNDAYFDIDNNIFMGDILHDVNNTKIIINRENAIEEKKIKINNNIKTFELEDIYQNHVLDAHKILKMIQIYSPSYIKEIVELLYFDTSKDNTENELDLTRKSRDLMLILFKEKDNDEILSKLHNDLIKKYWGRNL